LLVISIKEEVIVEMEYEFKNLFAAIFILLGSFWMFIAGVGINRFPDLYSRMHAATKAPSLGLALILIGAAIEFGGWVIWLQAGAMIFFIFYTNPISAHLISRAAFRAGYPLATKTCLNEMPKE